MLPLRDNIPTSRFPAVTVALIGINVAVWLLYQLPNLDGSIIDSAFFPCSVQGCGFIDTANGNPPGPPWPVDVFTSMFMHGSWLHIAGNMLFLWIFGNNVEDRLGRATFVVFYLLGGLAATALQSWITLQFGDVRDGIVPTVGASGAIAGVLGGYLILYPRARVLTLLFMFVPVEIPALFFLGGWFVFQLWQGGFDLLAPTGGGEGGVAFFAHVGGFLFGMLTIRVFAARPGRRGRRRPEPAWPRSKR
ncbi:MAG: rhomboid family intramembrane serine protease [Thermoleophilia bacterium]